MSEEDLEYYQKDTGEKDRNGNAIMRTYVRASRSFRREYIAKLRDIGITARVKPMPGQTDLNQIEFIYPEREYKSRTQETTRATAVDRRGDPLDERYDWNKVLNTLDAVKDVPQPKSGDDL